MMTPEKFDKLTKHYRGLILTMCSEKATSITPAEAELVRGELCHAYETLYIEADQMRSIEPFCDGLRKATGRHMCANRACGCSICTFVKLWPEEPPIPLTTENEG